MGLANRHTSSMSQTKISSHTAFNNDKVLPERLGKTGTSGALLKVDIPAKGKVTRSLTVTVEND